MESVTDALKAGDSVNFTGFGKFSAAARAARRASTRGPASACRSPRRTVPKFSAGSQLKAALKS